MFEDEDKWWTIIHDMPSRYDDVVLFRVEFYVVNRTGRTVLVRLSLDLNLVSS